MLRQLQTSSVAVVKDCFHAVDVACAQDFFEGTEPPSHPLPARASLLFTLLHEHVK
jgi:hypothetical protein